MEIENFKKWLGRAQQYQTDYFWKQIFEEKETEPSAKTTANPFTAFGEYFPKCDLYEVDGTIIAEIEIPGMNMEDVHISIDQQLLKVTGEFNTLKPQRKYYLKERSNRKFKKELTLPFPVLLNNIQSEFINGLLVIRMPLSSEETEDIPIFFDE